jgi:hypothetical protein
MANKYKHGAYAYIGASAAQSATSTGTITVYVGTAPVNLVKGYQEKNVVNLVAKKEDVGNFLKKLVKNPACNVMCT